MAGREKKGRCTGCGDPLWGEIVHLKLDARTHTYTDEFIPEEHFRGVFPFGRICAIAARNQHLKKKAASNWSDERRSAHVPSLSCAAGGELATERGR